MVHAKVDPKKPNWLGGRPKSKIDWDEVEKLLMEGCSGNEISAMLGINPHTLYDRCVTDKNIPFSEYSQYYYSKGNARIRKKQFQEAESGNTTLLIWLGKNRLGQREEKLSHEISEEINKKFEQVMTQLNLLQSSDNIAESNISNEQKS